MSWLARLKKNECAPETDTAKPTKPGFVGFVAPVPEPFQESAGDRGAVDGATDSAANDDAAPWRVSVAPGTPPDALARMRAASLALDKEHATATRGNGEVSKVQVSNNVSTEMKVFGGKVTANVSGETVVRKEQVRSQVRTENAFKGAYSENCSWPHTTAMNGAEIAAFTARLGRFTDMGLILADAEALADKLVQRDREGDNRRVCLECVHLHRAWRCGNGRAAGIAINGIDATLAGDFRAMLQRCDGFNDHHHQGSKHG